MIDADEQTGSAMMQNQPPPQPRMQPTPSLPLSTTQYKVVLTFRKESENGDDGTEAKISIMASWWTCDNDSFEFFDCVASGFDKGGSQSHNDEAASSPPPNQNQNSSVSMEGVDNDAEDEMNSMEDNTSIQIQEESTPTPKHEEFTEATTSVLPSVPSTSKTNPLPPEMNDFDFIFPISENQNNITKVELMNIKLNPLMGEPSASPAPIINLELDSDEDEDGEDLFTSIRVSKEGPGPAAFLLQEMTEGEEATETILGLPSTYTANHADDDDECPEELQLEAHSSDTELNLISNDEVKPSTSSTEETKKPTTKIFNSYQHLMNQKKRLRYLSIRRGQPRTRGTVKFTRALKKQPIWRNRKTPGSNLEDHEAPQVPAPAPPPTIIPPEKYLQEEESETAFKEEIGGNNDAAAIIEQKQYCAPPWSPDITDVQLELEPQSPSTSNPLEKSEEDASPSSSSTSRRKTPAQNKKKAAHICTTCSKTFSQRYHLVRHSLLHSNDRPFKCSKCSVGFYRKDHLTSHERHKGCGKRKVTETGKALPKPKATRTKHKVIIDQDTGKRLYFCSVCSTQFSRSDHLKRHITRVHSNEKPFKSEKQELPIHVKAKAHAKQEPEKVFHCSIANCSKSFSSKWKLDRHQLIHNTEKPFPCPICPKRYYRPDQLKYHMTLCHVSKSQMKTGTGSKSLPLPSTSKSNEARVECKECGKEFTMRQNLTRHMRDFHNKEKPFECSTCSQAFGRKDKLIRHQRTHRNTK